MCELWRTYDREKETVASLQFRERKLLESIGVVEFESTKNLLERELKRVRERIAELKLKP